MTTRNNFCELWDRFSAKLARKNILKRPQSIIISGESGSGKTETTKHIVQFLSNTASKDLMEALNHAGIVLSAFGNAATEINVNSSRYFKYIEVIKQYELK